MVGIILLIIGLGVAAFGVIYWVLLYKQDNATPGERVYTIQTTKISTDMNRYAAGKEAGASAARTDLAGQLNREALMYVEQISTRTLTQLAEYETIMSVDRRRREDMMLQAMQANQFLVLQAANEWRVSPQVYEQMIIEAVKQNHEFRSKFVDHQMRIEEHFQMKLIDSEYRKWLVEIDKEMGMLQRLLPYHEYNELSGMLQLAHGHLAQFESTSFPNEEVRKREEARLKQRIKAFQDALKRRRRDL